MKTEATAEPVVCGNFRALLEGRVGYGEPEGAARGHLRRG